MFDKKPKPINLSINNSLVADNSLNPFGIDLNPPKADKLLDFLPKEPQIPLEWNASTVTRDTFTCGCCRSRNSLPISQILNLGRIISEFGLPILHSGQSAGVGKCSCGECSAVNKL